MLNMSVYKKTLIPKARFCEYPDTCASNKLIHVPRLEEAHEKKVR